MKKILSFLLVIIGLCGYSQDEYYRKVDWKFYPDNVVQLTDSTYLTDAIPFDYNDVGAIQRVVGNYVVDFVGHRYEVIDSTTTTITVLDIYHIGQAPQTGQIARCYRSVGNGEAEYIGSIDYSPLDESSRWKLNGSDNELLWRQTIGKAENGLYKDFRTVKLGGDLIEPTSINQDNNSLKILNNGHGSVFSETGIVYTKIDTVDFTDSTLVTKMYVKSLIKEGTSHDSLTIAAGSTDYFEVNYPQIFSGQKLIDTLGVMNTKIAGKAPVSGSANYIWNGTDSQTGNFNITGRGVMGAFDIGSYGYQQSRIYGGSDLFFLTSTSGVGLYAGGEKLFFYNGLGGLNILELDRLTNSISVPNGSINTGGNYLKNSTPLLLDWLKSGSAPTSGSIVVGNGTTTNPSGVSVNQAIGDNALSAGWLISWDGAKVVNFINPSVQSLSGTTPTLNASNGVNANISISGATTLTLSNLVSGTSGTIYLTNNASVYRIKIAGYTIAPASNITYDSTGILLPASSVYTHTSIGWYYNGTTVQIHKADYNTTTY